TSATSMGETARNERIRARYDSHTGADDRNTTGGSWRKRSPPSLTVRRAGPNLSTVDAERVRRSGSVVVTYSLATVDHGFSRRDRLLASLNLPAIRRRERDIACDSQRNGKDWSAWGWRRPHSRSPHRSCLRTTGTRRRLRRTPRPTSTTSTRSSTAATSS